MRTRGAADRGNGGNIVPALLLALAVLLAPLLVDAAQRLDIGVWSGPEDRVVAAAANPAP